MALGKGIGIMGRGADIDPESLAQRQKLAQQLYAGSLSPQQPERSWTQGAARLAQSLMSGYEQAQIEKERKQYGEQQAQGIAALLSQMSGGGDITPESISSLPVNQQIMALQMAQQQRERDMSRQDRQTDREASFEMKRQERDLDPIKRTQDEIYRYEQALEDPQLPEHLRPEAEKRIAQLQTSIGAMSPSRTTVNVDASQKAEDAGEKKYKELQAESTVKAEDQNIALGRSASDSLYRLEQINKAIENGSLSNVNTTNLGQALQTGAARLGLPNDSAKIAEYIQTANQQLVDARKQLAGQGQISDRETRMLERTVLDPKDTIQATQAKAYVFKQLAERQKLIGDLTIEWKKRFGSTRKPSNNGMSFDEVVQRAISRNPLVSYEEMMQQKANAASAQIEKGAQE